MVLESPFSFRSTIPIQFNSVVTSLTRLLATFARWFLFSTFDFARFALAEEKSEDESMEDIGGTAYVQPCLLRVLGSALPGFLGRGMVAGPQSGLQAVSAPHIPLLRAIIDLSTRSV